MPYTIDLSEMGFSDAGEKGTGTAPNRNRIGGTFSTKREKCPVLVISGDILLKMGDSALGYTIKV